MFVRYRSWGNFFAFPLIASEMWLTSVGLPLWLSPSFSRDLIGRPQRLFAGREARKIGRRAGKWKILDGDCVFDTEKSKTCGFIRWTWSQHLFDERSDNWAFNAASAHPEWNNPIHFDRVFLPFSSRHYASHISQCLSSALSILLTFSVFFCFFFKYTNWAFVSLWMCELTGGRGNAIWIYREPMR